MHRIKTLTALLIAVTLVVPLFAVLLTEPPSSGRVGIEFDLYIYVSIATTLGFIGAAILFIMGFGGFTAKLKRAYGTICLGLVFYGLAQFQIPVLTVTNQLETTWTRSGFIAIPFLVALIALFWGMRLFARLIGVKSIWASPWFVFLLSAAAAVVATFVPHFGPSSAEVAFDSSVAFSTWGSGIIAASAILALQIKRAANVSYTNALAWMFIAFLGIALVGIHYLLSIILLGDRSEYAEGVGTLATYCFAGLIFIRAAYAFNAIGTQPVSSDMQRNFFGHPQEITESGTVSSIDIVVYATQLVSNPSAINQEVDRVRSITSSLGADRQLTPTQTSMLKEVYLSIEYYLTDKEPVRKFTRDSLRHEIQSKLRLNPNSNSTFWSQL
jgi:hypothetical protein